MVQGNHAEHLRHPLSLAHHHTACSAAGVGPEQPRLHSWRCRCFEDTKKLDVRVIGAWLPMTWFGFATVICATMRMLAIAMHLAWQHFRGNEHYDHIVVDQVSTANLYTFSGTASGGQ